jgi:hypothetical protein
LWARNGEAVRQAMELGEIGLLLTSLRESLFSMAYSHPYESNPMTWRSP